MSGKKPGFIPLIIIFVLALLIGLAIPIAFFAWGDDGKLAKPTGQASNSGLCANIPEPYAQLFTSAGDRFKVQPAMIAAIFVGEHRSVKDSNYNDWPDADGPWKSSPVGASGPFQFMPKTWQEAQQDGDGDGDKDIQSLADATFAAAFYLSKIGAGSSTTDEAALMNAASRYNSGRPWDKPGNDGLSGQDIAETKRYVTELVMPSFRAFRCEGTQVAGVISGNYSCPMDVAVAKKGANWGDVLRQRNYRTGTYPGHEGLDIMADVGSSVYSVSDGKVVKTSTGSKGGPDGKPYSTTSVTIEEKPGVYWYYTHLTQISTSVGTTVKKGALIGRSGSANGPHLHIGISKRLNDRGTANGYNWAAWYYPYEFLRLIDCVNPPAPETVNYP